MPNFSAKRRSPHRFVPDGFDPANVSELGKLYDRLEARDVETRDGLEGFILDWEELEAALHERYTATYIDMTVDTTNPEYEKRYLDIVENVLPVREKRGFALKKKVLASPAVGQLGEQYAMLLRNIKS